MKEKFNKIIATGLLASMIATFSACDTGIVGDINTNDLDTNQMSTTANQCDTTTDVVTTTSNNTNNFDIKADLHGDVWDAVKLAGKSEAVYYAGVTENPIHLPIPVQFLTEQGILSCDSNGQYHLLGNQPKHAYHPLKSQVFIDKTTEENDVYVLVQYLSDSIYGENADDAYTVTWKLKYLLDDDDYQSLLKLENEFRQRYFIQEMDKIYQPEIMSKSVALYSMLYQGSPFVGDKLKNDGEFPYVYIEDINYDTQVITYAAKIDKGYCVYDLNIRNSKIWHTSIDRFGITEQQREDSIVMSYKNTPFGPCLKKFTVCGINAGLLDKTIAGCIQNAHKVYNLYNTSANSTKSKYNLVSY